MVIRNRIMDCEDPRGHLNCSKCNLSTDNYVGCLHSIFIVNDCVINTLQWCHNEYDGVSNHHPYDCFLYRKHQSSGSLVFVREFHRWPVNSPHKGPVTRKIFPFDDVTMHSKSRPLFGDKVNKLWHWTCEPDTWASGLCSEPANGATRIQIITFFLFKTVKHHLFILRSSQNCDQWWFYMRNWCQ